MKRYLGILVAFCAMTQADAIPLKRILIDSDWEFCNTGISHKEDYAKIMSRASSWEKISLPHDWSILNDFDDNQSSGNDGGYLPTGTGWYRRVLNIPESMVGKPYHLYFEGIYMDSEIYLNGQRIGGHPYGYTSFRCEAGPYLKPGENLLVVKVDNSRQKNSRWYSGSGIYRHVWLEPHGEIYIEPWSLHVTTASQEDNVSIAKIGFIIAAPGNDGERDGAKVCVTVNVDGSAPVTDTVTIQPGEKVKYCTYEIKVKNPRLWSPSTPALYTANVELSFPDGTKESESERFGFRTLEYSAEKGFILNGKPTLITGACMHHDNGILGAASYDDAEIRKARLLKEAGFNAVRTSHNPPAPAFLDACDSLGLLVIDEAFDGWRAAKNTYDYSTLIDEWWDSDISSLVKRDRNHPSVIAWSIGNEIIERKSPQAVETALKLSGKCRELDGTRPVTQALAAWDPEWEIYDPLASTTEITGYNYMIHKAESDHERVPSRVIWQTESYPRDAFSNWEKVNDLSYVIGDFVWTGIDYVGESGIGRYWYEGDPEGEHYHRPLWPWHNSYCGDIDIIGIRKPISYYRQILYSDTPALHLSVKEPQGYKGKIKEGLWAVYPSEESWNWPGHEGKPIEVEVASNYASVELYHNGQLVGRQQTDRMNKFKAVFTVNYAPGEIKAVALDKKGNRLAEETLVTAGKPYAIRLTSDRHTLDNFSQSLVYITAEIVDSKGNIVPDAKLPISFLAEGGGEILATGSGDPKDPDGYYRKVRKAYKGRALAIVKANGTETGDIKVVARSKGLKPATLSIGQISGK